MFIWFNFFVFSKYMFLVNIFFDKEWFGLYLYVEVGF